MEYICVILLAVILGVVIGIKVVIWAQLVPLALAIWLVKRADGQGIGEEAVLAFTMLFVLFGIFVGDIIYYCNFYNGGHTIGQTIAWLFHP